MTAAVLETSGLHAGYGGGDILQGLTFAIEQGEMVAIIGRNGVGKTTLMKTIIGLLPASAGSIRFKQQAVERLRADQRAALGIGYVPQGREVFPELTVEENLMMGELINRVEKVPRYDLVYEYFPILKARRRQAAGTFSGGQQQMLAIGRALVGCPDLLLLDEPSVGIQPNIVQEIGEAVARLNRDEGLTILLVEQHTGLIEATAQRAYAMDKGRIVANLTEETLRNRSALLQYLSI